MATTVGKKPTTPAAIPVGPSIEAWRAMTPDERISFLVHVNSVLSDVQSAMPEGRPHMKARNRAIDALNLHFRTIGRVVYLADDTAVVYPGQPSFCPDVLAVLDVEEPEDDERMAWVVADEGKGPDLVIEVLHRGDRAKDLVQNVERYAQLGIPEYFVYDRLRQRILGYRLPDVPTAVKETPAGAAPPRRYQAVLPQLGHYRSNVLQLDLTIVGDRLRFLSGEAELPGSADSIGRLQGMVESLATKADRAEADVEQARVDVEQARTDAEQARADAARARADADLARARSALFTVLQVRGLVVPDVARERILAEEDPERLEQWLKRAVSAASLATVLDEPG